MLRGFSHHVKSNSIMYSVHCCTGNTFTCFHWWFYDSNQSRIRSHTTVHYCLHKGPFCSIVLCSRTKWFFAHDCKTRNCKFRFTHGTHKVISNKFSTLAWLVFIEVWLKTHDDYVASTPVCFPKKHASDLPLQSSSSIAQSPSVYPELCYIHKKSW